MINYSITMRSVNANPPFSTWPWIAWESSSLKARKSASAISVISPSSSHPRAQKIADKFTAQNITDVKVLWEPGSEFKNLLADAEFNLVASRSAQAAVIKAIKAGKANVDISTPTTPGDGSDGGGSNPSGDNKGAPLLPKS